MLCPAFLLTAVLCYLPLVGWWLAFTDYHVGDSLFGGDFVGLRQFSRLLFESSDLGYLIRNTLVINGLTIVINITVALVLSVLLRELLWKPGAKFVQTIFFFPYFISWVIMYSIVWALFAVNSGAINQLLVSLGVIEKGFNILGSAKYSWGLMIVLNLFKHTGYNCIIFLATISGIPQEQYESASLDGAGRFAKIWYITLPNLIPTASILLIMNSGWIFSNNLEQFFVFTNATNWETMEVLDMYIYKFGLQQLDYPYATAVGILKTLVSIIVLVVVNKTVKKLSDTSVF